MNVLPFKGAEYPYPIHQNEEIENKDELGQFLAELPEEKNKNSSIQMVRIFGQLHLKNKRPLASHEIEAIINYFSKDDCKINNFEYLCQHFIDIADSSNLSECSHLKLAIQLLTEHLDQQERIGVFSQYGIFILYTHTAKVVSIINGMLEKSPDDLERIKNVLSTALSRQRIGDIEPEYMQAILKIANDEIKDIFIKAYVEAFKKQGNPDRAVILYKNIREQSPEVLPVVKNYLGKEISKDEDLGFLTKGLFKSYLAVQEYLPDSIIRKAFQTAFDSSK